MKRLLILFLLVLSIVNATGQLPLTNTSSTYRTRSVGGVDSANWEQEFKDYYYALTAPRLGTGLDTADAFNSFVKTIKDNDAVLDSLDAMWIHAVNTSTNAQVELISPGVNDASLDGTPTFTKWQGYTGSTNNALNTAYNPTTDRVHFGLNHASIGVYVRNDLNITSAVISSGSASTCSLFPRNSGVISIRINTGTTESETIASSVGMTIATRTSSTAEHIYKNGSPLSDETRTSTAMPNANFEILQFSAVGYWSTFQSSMEFVGGALSATQVATLTDAFETLMDYLNTGVIAYSPMKEYQYLLNPMLLLTNYFRPDYNYLLKLKTKS